VALLGASFQIGRSALSAYQAALAITGQNIANAANPDYTRLSGRLSSLEGGLALGNIRSGGGVSLSALQRHIDEALEARLRLALSARSGAQARWQALSQIETLYNELTDRDLSSSLRSFFNSFLDVQNSPADSAVRNQVIVEADALIGMLRRQRRGLLAQVAELNGAVAQTAARASALAQELASLNEQIAAQEARGPGYGAPLKDRRDALLRELSELMDIEVRQADNGTVSVYVGGEPLVEFNRSRGLTVENRQIDGITRATLRFADDGGTVVVREGLLAAQIASRDEDVIGQIEALDQLAAALIYEVNRVHSTGRGLVGYTSLTSSAAAADPQAALNSSAAGLSFPVASGTFLVQVRDRQSGATVTRQIEVRLDGVGQQTSLSSLASQLSAVPGLTATVSADGRLQITAQAGYEFSFSDDRSGVLAALGIAGFFQGSDAETIDVAAALRGDVRLLAASASGESGDGENAARIALLGRQASTLLGGRSIEDFHQAMVDTVASRTASAEVAYEAADAVHSTLAAQRETISGVSLDEEAINLAKFERAYQGATRYLSVLNTLAEEVMSLVR
jgi:flagellar hook-associated protein 1 FlgK